MSSRTRQDVLNEMVAERDALHVLREKISKVSREHPADAATRALPLQEQMRKRIKGIESLAKELSEIPV